MPDIAVIPGDGIGPEVTGEALRIIDELNRARGADISARVYDYGACRYIETGRGMPENALDELKEYDGILLGAFGDSRVPGMEHVREIVMGLRLGLDLYANIRPVRVYDPSLCPLKNVEKGVELTVIRENTEGLYCGEGFTENEGESSERAVEKDISTRKGVERILRYAFRYCRERGIPVLTMTDKSNVLTSGHGLWKRHYDEISGEYGDIDSRHLYIDALVMRLVKNPAEFPVIVTCNMFGDILSDLTAMLQGGLGTAASCNLNPETGRVLFEPVHGSAPDIAGKGTADPLGAILCVKMICEHFSMDRAADILEKSVEAVIGKCLVTPDLGGELTTSETADAVIEEMRKQY